MNAAANLAPRASASLMTPVGRGAIASVVVCGRDAALLIDRWFQPLAGGSLSAAAPRRIVLGRWGGPAGEEVVACRIDTQRVEIHCHGGPTAAQRLLDDLAAAGATIQSWQQHLAHEQPDPWRRQALEQLAAAATERVAVILLDQAHGALERELQDVAADLRCGNGPAAQRRLQAMLASAELGRRLAAPWRVALFGRPNVGKSSLLNALAGYQRSIAFDRPGTTRDAVTVSTAIDGWPIELIDTAGLRRAGDELEQAGIARARQVLQASDLAILVSDRSAGWTPADAALFGHRPSALLVHNKCDLTPGAAAGPPGLKISCTTGAGLASVQREIVRRLVPHPPPIGAAVPITPQQVAVVEQAAAAVAAGDAAWIDRLLASRC